MLLQALELLVSMADGETAAGHDAQEGACLVEQEREEAWIMEEVKRGAALPGLYPMNAQTRARYEAEHKPGGLR